MNKHLLLAVLDDKSTRVERMVFGNRSVKPPLLGVDCYCGESKWHLLALAKDVVKEDSLQIRCQLLKALIIYSNYILNSTLMPRYWWTFEMLNINLADKDSAYDAADTHWVTLLKGSEWSTQKVSASSVHDVFMNPNPLYLCSLILWILFKTKGNLWWECKLFDCIFRFCITILWILWS